MFDAAAAGESIRRVHLAQFNRKPRTQKQGVPAGPQFMAEQRRRTNSSGDMFRLPPLRSGGLVVFRGLAGCVGPPASDLR